MADAQLRDLERRIRAGELVDDQVLVAALLRAGARDPRRRPRRGDVVEGPWRGQPRRWEIVEWPIVRRVYTSVAPRVSFPGQQVIKGLLRRRLYGADATRTGIIELRSWRRWARDGRVLRIACSECCGLGFNDGEHNFPPCHPCAGTGWALSPELEVHVA